MTIGTDTALRRIVEAVDIIGTTASRYSKKITNTLYLFVLVYDYLNPELSWSDWVYPI